MSGMLKEPSTKYMLMMVIAVFVLGMPSFAAIPLSDLDLIFPIIL
jgi:hypothetical protein